MSVVLHRSDGVAERLAVARWHAPATHGERRLLATLAGPVLDIGCGPGRLVRALVELGVPALGLDASARAIEIGRAHV